MKVVTIIAEYNPLHGGHAWQIQKSRELFGRDCGVIVAMSGCFTQRGEPAVFDKWTRADMALACGADLVFELPAVFATASAKRFAAGGVGLLAATGLKGTLVFGSEAGRLEPLRVLADHLAEEPDAYRKALQSHLGQGLSFPAARQKAVAETLPQSDLADLLHGSNNILGIEYLQALKRQGVRRLTPHALPRQGQAYRDASMPVTSQQASATAIRAAMQSCCRSFEGQTKEPLIELVESLLPQMPGPALAQTLASLQSGPGPLFAQDLAPLILSKLRASSDAFLDAVPGMEEGLGRRLKQAASRPAKGTNAPSLAQLMQDAGTRRFPQTRIQRALCALLLGMQSSKLQPLLDAGPQYLRVLAFNRSGRHLLRLMRRLAHVPLILNGSDFLEHGHNKPLCQMASIDRLATDLWHLASGRACGHDFDTPAIMR